MNWGDKTGLQTGPMSKEVSIELEKMVATTETAHKAAQKETAKMMADVGE